MSVSHGAPRRCSLVMPLSFAIYKGVTTTGSLVANQYLCWMFELLLQKFTEKISLTSDEMEQCKRFFSPKKLRRRQYFLQQDDVCRHTAFIVSGLLRSYTVDDEGEEHIIQFASQGWWLTDLYSNKTGRPTIINIDALEDCELLLLSRADEEALLQQIPKLERYFRLLLENGLIAAEQRLIYSLGKPAEEKYRTFIDIYPDLVQRVPLHMIASYLGVTPETLSRVRKQILERRTPPLP
jgi:CRP-like cAMP-binding protein